MEDTSKKFFIALKHPTISLLILAVMVPMVVLSQEATTTTPISADGTFATTTSSMATTSDAFSTSLPTSGVATSTEEVSVESTESVVEEVVEDSSESITLSLPPPLSIRKFDKKMNFNKRALHSCKAETFRVDVSGRSSAQVQVMLLRNADLPYEVEIGGLPDGIDITFEKNGSYQYTQSATDRYLTLTIHNQDGSQKGDFSIPIFYTQKGTKDSSVICQINIVNQ